MCVGDAHGLRLYLTNEHQTLSLAPPTEQGCTIMHRAAEHGALDCGKMIWSVRPDSIYDCDKKVGGVITMATNFSNTMKIALIIWVDFHLDLPLIVIIGTYPSPLGCCMQPS